MSLSRPTLTDDDGSRTTGTIWNAAWWSDLFDRMDAAYASLTGAAFTGLVDLSSATAGQIKFPATQVPSTNANTLDDYEEGTWTPVLGGSGGTSGQSYTAQVGAYVKIGKFVYASAYIVLSNKGTITTNLEIQGLPFTAENVSNQFVPATVNYWNAFSTSINALGGHLFPNTSAIRLNASTAAATSNVSPLTTTDIGNTSAVMMSIVYKATA